MLKIRIKDNKNYKISNDERYIHIDEYYYSDLPDINDIKILNELDLLYESDGYSSSEEDIFVDILSCFNSICDLGRSIYETNIFKSINEINYKKKKIDKKYETIYTLLYEWIKLNGNPYNYIEPRHSDLYDILPEDRLMQFVYDSLICYTFYQINTSLLWLDNYDDEDEDGIIIMGTVAAKIKQLVDFLNLETLCKDTMDELYITNSKILNNLYLDDTIKEDLNVLKEGNIESAGYQISINRILISIISYIITFRNYDFLITSQRLIYIKNIKMFSLFENAESLIGIAYYQLLLNLTSSDLPYNIRRCKNPNCSIMFHSRYRQQYCNKEECQKYRKNKKSHDYYHRHSQQKKKRKKAKNP